jgi:uncharacterized protein
LAEHKAEQADALDLVLLLLAAPGAQRPNEVEGITRLEKLLYLAEKETDVPSRVVEPFRFEAYDYGPYSKDVYEAVELLEGMDLVRETRIFRGSSLDEGEEVLVGADREGIERRFHLTDNGLVVATELGKRYPDVAASLAKVKKAYAKMPLRQLLRYVYSVYPEVAEKSKIRSDILGGSS